MMAVYSADVAPGQERPGPRPRGHKSRDEETFYKVEFSMRPDIAPETFTEREINAGEWLAHWPGQAITSPRDKHFYADILKSQVVPFRLPVGRAKSETGWHQDAVSRLWTYAFRDGRLLVNEPELRETGIPIAGYNFSGSTHGHAWLDRMAEAPSRAAAADVTRLFSWLDTVDTAGRQALLCFGTYRSLIASIERMGMALLIAAADDIEAKDGSAGAGKTTSIDFARGVDGPCPFQSEPECSFRGTLAGIETRITHIHDLPVSVADFHLPEAPTESEFSKWAGTVDALVSSAADNAEIKERSTKTLDARHGATIGGLLIMDGERLHPLLLSRLRRVAILFFRRGEINAEEMHAHWDEYQGIHTRIGHSILRAALGALNKDESSFRRKIRAMEADYEQQLYTRFLQEHPDFDKQIGRSLAHNFARFVSGARLAETATGAAGLVSFALALAYHHMQEQSRLLANGGPSTVTREWILKTTRLLLDESRAHALAMDNSELDYKKHGMLQIWGYKRTGLVDKPWAVNGPHLLNLSDNGQTCYVKSTLWQELLKGQAQRERLKWTHTERTFAEALVRMDVITPEYDKQGQRTKSAQRVYIDGKRERRLAIETALLDIDNQGDEEDTPPEPPDGQGQEHTTEPPAISAPAPAGASTEGLAAARALLDEMAARGCSLRLDAVWLDKNLGGIWAIIVPSEWTDEAYNALETRVLALNCELCQLLDARIPEGSGPAGQEPPAISAPAPARRPADTTEGAAKKWTGGVKRQYREYPTAFADVESGLVLCGEETRQVGPRAPLSAILAALPREIERVYLTGGRPGDGDVDGLYSWLREPVLGGNWQAGKLHIDADLPVLSLSHVDTKQKVDVRRVAAWFGEGTYGPYQARQALATLDRLLQETFDSKARCLTTPGSTGLDLWDRSRVCDYPVLSQEYQSLLEGSMPYAPRPIRDVIKSSSGQGRIELCPVAGRETLPSFAYLDGRFEYAALGNGLGFGPAEHDRVPTFEPLRRGRYFIRFTVPPDWSHVGIFPVKRDDSRGGWWYPGQESAGQTFETWADASEIRLALQPPRGMTPWHIEVVERLLLQSASAGHPWPLDVWCKKLVNLRQAIAGAQDIPEDIRPLLLAAARSILLHGVGSFARSMRDELVIVSPQDTAALASLPAEYSPVSHDDGTWSYTRPARLSSWSQRMMHPEFSAAIWARCRTHLLYAAKKQGRGQIAYETGAFLMPRDWLVGFRTDAIYATSDPHWPDDGVTPGQFRLKGYLNGPCAQPGAAGRASTEKDYRLLNSLRDKSEAYLKDYKG